MPSLHTLIRRAQRALFPPADEREGFGALLILLAVIFCNLLGFGIIVPLLPFYAQSFDAEPWQIALLFSAYSFGAFFGEPVWGRLSDRIGRKPLLISTVTGNFLCYFVLAFAPNIFIAFAVRFLGGMTSGNASVIQGYIADVTPSHLRSGRMALVGVAFNVGFIVGPALGGLLAAPELGPIGFRLPILTASLLCLASAIGVLLFVSESRKRAEDAAAQPSRWAMIGFAAKNPVVSRLILVTFFAGFAFTGIESTFGLWGHARHGWGPREIGMLFGATGVVAALCQTFLTGWLSRVYGEARMLAAGMGIAMICSFLQIFSAGLLTSMILMAIGALGNSVAFPNVSALISRATDANNQGQIFGLNNAAGAFSRVTGPLIANTAFAHAFMDAPFVLAAFIVAPAIVLALGAGAAAQRLERSHHHP